MQVPGNFWGEGSHKRVDRLSCEEITGGGANESTTEQLISEWW